MVVVPLRKRGDADLLFVDKILYRQLTATDFCNIEYVKKPRGNNGTGQTYIDISGISTEEVEEFFTYCESEDEVVQKTGRKKRVYYVDAIQVGTKHSFIIKIDKRRESNYAIANQQNNRYPGWTSSNGFPTIVGDGCPFEAGTWNENDITDPIVRPIVEHLTVYIVRTLNHLYFADFIADPIIPECWPSGVGLEALLKEPKTKQTGGIIKPSKLIEFCNIKESVSSHGV